MELVSEPLCEEEDQQVLRHSSAEFLWGKICPVGMGETGSAAGTGTRLLRTGKNTDRTSVQGVQADGKEMRVQGSKRMLNQGLEFMLSVWRWFWKKERVGQDEGNEKVAKQEPWSQT